MRWQDFHTCSHVFVRFRTPHIATFGARHERTTIFMKSSKSPNPSKSQIFISFGHFAEYDHIWRTRQHRTDQIMLKNMKNVVQTFSNASETCVLEGKNFPAQLQMGISVMIALRDFMNFMKSPKSIKILDFHQS